MTASAPRIPSAASPPIGLIAGQGQLPVIVAQGMRAAGRRVACIGLRDQFTPELPGLCDDFAEAGIVQLGRWLRLARRFGVTEAVMVGRVAKAPRPAMGELRISKGGVCGRRFGIGTT